MNRIPLAAEITYIIYLGHVVIIYDAAALRPRVKIIRAQRFKR